MEWRHEEELRRLKVDHDQLEARLRHFQGDNLQYIIIYLKFVYPTKSYNLKILHKNSLNTKIIKANTKFFYICFY